MPDHVHWLFSLDEGPLDRVMQRFKSRAARAVNVARGRRGTVWQEGYHDHAVRMEENIRDLARYVVANPVRSGLVRRAGDYPFWDAAWL
jgi:REP element-mobilizing transposase RayT